MWLGLLLTTAVVVAQLGGARWLRTLESATFDWRIRHVDLVPDEISPHIVHVDIDDAALRRLGKWPWSRPQLAAMIDVLKESGSRVVVMDVMTEDPDAPRWQLRADGSFMLSYPDVVLAEAIRRAGNVVLAVDAVPAIDAAKRLSMEAEIAARDVAKRVPAARPGLTLGLPDRVMAPPRPIFAKAAERIGAVHLSIESSELSVHELPAWQSSGDIVLPHLGVAAAAAYLNVPPTELVPDPDKLVLGRGVTQLREGIMLVPWAIRRGATEAAWDVRDDDPEWVRVHRHVSAAPLVELGERRVALREMVSYLLNKPFADMPNDADLAQADEEANFLLSAFAGKDLAAERTRLEASTKLEDTKVVATLELLERYQRLRALAGSDGADSRMLAQLREIFAGKIVFFGWIATGAAVDMHRTPLGARTPGVVVHAAVANGLLAGRNLQRVPGWMDVAATIALGMGAVVLSVWLNPGRATFWCAAMGLGFAAINSVALYDAMGVVLVMAAPLVAGGLSWAACTTQRAIVLRNEKAAIRKQFSTRVPSALVDYLAEHPDLTNLAGEEREVTVLFTDFTGFAGAAEKMDGRSTVALLNNYLRALTDVLTAHGGYVNKFLGDGVMCFWNAPFPEPRHALRACEAVAEATAVIGKLNSEREARGEVALALRVGIATGKVIVGDCGAPPKFNDYTVIGDAVNLAARLESANKQLGTDVLLTRSTIDAMPESERSRLVLRPLGLVRVQGQSRGAEVWELVGSGAASPETLEWIARTCEAVRLFRSGDYANAIEIWRDLVLADRGQAGALLYVQRCHELMEAGRVDDVLPLRGK